MVRLLIWFNLMYIIVIAWLYVTLLMAATENSITAGVLTFGFYGLLPCSILMWILGVKHRKFKRNQQSKDATQEKDE